MTKKSLVTLIIISVIIVLVVVVGMRYFKSPGMLDSLKEKLGGSQTVGQVTLNQGGDQVKIEEVADPSAPNSLSPVIGKTYKITALKANDQPVHVEFSYDPGQLQRGIPETVLGLYKWYDGNGQKYWARLASQTDTTRHIVSADLTEFSIIGVRAPLAYYWSQPEIDALNSYLNQLISYVPPYSCGVLIIIEEELLEWKFGELVEAYLRPEEEQMVSQGCVKRPEAPYSVLSDSQGYEREVTWNLPATGQTERVQYDIQLAVEWQLDDEESAVVTGTVKDQDNKPLEGILILADKQTYAPWRAGTITDADGHFKISLPSGEYQFVFNPSGQAGEAVAESETGNSSAGNKPTGGKMVKPDKVKILAQGTKISQPPAKALPNDPKKHKNCQKLTWREILHEFGDQPHDPLAPIVRHGPWNKDITLTCAKYYIDDTVELPIDVTVAGMTLIGTETDTIAGQQLVPVKGGYGWEGQWQATHQLKTETKLKGGMMDLGPVKVQTPQNTQASQDFYEYTFTLPLKPVPGTPFVIYLHRPEGAYQVSAQQAAGISQYNVLGQGFQMSGPATGSSHSAKSVDTTYEGKILEVYGERGALLEFSPAMAKEKIKVKIQKN